MKMLDQLFIRACKSGDANKRIKSVYRRFYHYDYDSANIVHILAKICDNQLQFSAIDLISELSPNNNWKYPDNYWEKCVNILISKIRLSEVSKFDGLVAPLKFRRLG